MPRSDAFREAVYREYMDFFEKAEKKRRWNVFDDIPWDALDPSKNDDDAAFLAETFVGVEMYLPDYVSSGINLIRETFGQAWFAANWAYEESKHALSLREYLVRSGQRTSKDMFELEKHILSRRWELPFSTPRQMTFYGAVQEQATLMLYRRQRDCARARGDRVLASIYGHIAKDEAAHASFYRRVVQLELEEDRSGTLEDMARVFRNFRMPADDLVPNYAERTAMMREKGGVDRGVFLREVWFPTLRKLGVSRQELMTRSPAGRKSGLKDAA